MKVLYFVHTFGEQNGIANHVARLVENLPAEVKAEVVSGSGRGLPFFSSLRLPVAECLRALSSDFDIMHIHGYGNFYSFFGALACIVRRKPLVWTIHGYPRIRGMRRALYIVYRHFMAPFIFWKASRIISVSSDILPTLANETGNEIEVLPNGVDLERFKPKGSYRKAKCLGFVGRLDEDKGVERLLECRSLPLLFVGPDEDGGRKKLERAATSMGIEARFELVPYEKMPEEYEKCRYVALPSRYEGFPLTLLESVAMERPFVCTAVGENARVLSELFSKPEKYLLSGNLGEKIAELERQNLEAELSAARKKAATYSWKAVARKVAKIYWDAVC
jgi:glycosyltransferase involved in cell wall biosynthesis